MPDWKAISVLDDSSIVLLPGSELNGVSPSRTNAMVFTKSLRQEGSEKKSTKII